MSWWGLLRSPFATVGFLADIAIQSAVVNRFYCNRCGGGYYTGQHNCLRRSVERVEALGPYEPAEAFASPTGVPPSVGDGPVGVEHTPAPPTGPPTPGIDYDALSKGPW